MAVNYTLIIKMDRTPIPSEGSLRLFISEKLKSATIKVDYYGFEIDNEFDYLDEDLKNTLGASNFITFHLECENAPEIRSSSKEIVEFVSRLFEERNSEIRVDQHQKDIEIYFN